MVCLPFLAYGQTATIVGTITDPSGAVVPNVTITVTHVETNRAITLTSNEAGQYVVPDIPIGHYNVKASATGFKVAERTGIVLDVSQRERIDFQLVLGTTAQSVSVEANAVAVQTDTGEVSSLVSGSQITELSTNGRSIYTYVSLTPGAASLMPDFQAPTPVGANSSISFNGNRPGHNLYLLDGGENSDRGGAGSSSVMPSMDAIAETQTLASNYSADYGLSSGGTITSVVKSGSKTLHASAWEFFRNDWLDAANPFTKSIPYLRYNVYGFNAGGPVTFGHLYNPNKSKTFFFYNMEWRKMIQGGTLNQQVPDQNTYGGDFAGYVPANFTLKDKTPVPYSGLHEPCQYQLSAAQQLLFTAQTGFPGFSTPGVDGDCSVHQTNSAGVAETLAQQPTFFPYPGNALPFVNTDSTSLLKAGGKYGGIFPGANGVNSSGNPVFLGGNNAPTFLREEIVRIDHNFTDKFSIYGHYVAEQVDQNYGTTLWSGDNSPSIGSDFGNPSYAAVIHAAYTISPSLVNEVAFNYNGNRIHIVPLAGSLSTLPSGFTFNGYFPSGAYTNPGNLIPQINLGGATGANYQINWMPWNNKADDYQIRDDVSWTKGRHQLRMGFGWALYKKTQDWFKDTEGSYTFNGNFTGNDFADYLLGYAQDYGQDAIKQAGQWNNVSPALYIQDNYRVNNRLTLNLGLRWDGIPHTYEANYNMDNFFPKLYSSANAAQLAPGGGTVLSTSPGLGPSPNPELAGQDFYVNGIATCGKNGTPRGCVNDAWLNFQPRVGFAYDLHGNGKTVIRGGYGVMNERIQGNDVYNNAGTVPLAASADFKNVLFNNGPSQIAGGAGSTPIPVNNIEGLDISNYKAPRSTQFSLGVQQAFGKSVLSIAYVGTQNRHQNYYENINLVPYNTLAALQTGSCTAINGACSAVGATPLPYNSLVTYSGYNNIELSRNEANGDYNGLQMSLRGSFLSNDLTYQLGYTYSHTNDPSNSGDMNGDSNPYVGWKYDWGPSQYDQRQVFFANFVYDIPLMKHSDNHFAKTMIGGWEVSAIIGANDGVPINIGVSGQNVCSVVAVCSNRADITGKAQNPHTAAEWFDTSVYSAPAAGTWGNAPRYGVRGPGRDNWNMSLFKNFTFSESRGSYLQLRGEFFNVWNHLQLDPTQVSSSVGSSNFGAITGAHDPRAIQLALKLYF